MSSWRWSEIEELWRHPELTAEELHELLPSHTPAAIAQQRKRVGRWNRAAVPLCCMCEQRPVWAESARAKRYGLCKSCFVDEERRRLEDEARAVALRQRRRKLKRKLTKEDEGWS